MATTTKTAEGPTFTVAELAASQAFANVRDVVAGCLDTTKMYTAADAHSAVDKILKKKVI